jgi:hypothetical protein
VSIQLGPHASMCRCIYLLILILWFNAFYLW